MDVPAEQHAVGDPLPPHYERLDIHVGELKPPAAAR
jgi:hypothetical protein